METLTHKDIKKFCRPYTAKALNAPQMPSFRYSEESNCLSNGQIVIFAPSQELIDIAQPNNALAQGVEKVISNLENVERTFPTATAKPKGYVRGVQFVTETGKTFWVDANYLRMIWDKCPGGTFYFATIKFSYAVPVLILKDGGRIVGMLCPLSKNYRQEETKENDNQN